MKRTVDPTLAEKQLDLFGKSEKETEKAPESVEEVIAFPDPDDPIDIFEYQNDPGKLGPDIPPDDPPAPEPYAREPKSEVEIEVERMLAELVCKYLSAFGLVFKPFDEKKPDLAALYDKVLIMNGSGGGGRWRVAIDTFSPRHYRKYGSIPIDFLDGYILDEDLGADFAKRDRISGSDVSNFMDCVDVKLPGKLFGSKAHTLALYCPVNVDAIWLLAMSELIENRDYFVQKYGLVVRSRPSMGLDSCFCPVGADDERLARCGMKIEEASKL